MMVVIAVNGDSGKYVVMVLIVARVMVVMVGAAVMGCDVGSGDRVSVSN